ncbi:MAG: cytochrome c-type biogenesis protein [Gaiellales bacterium]
MRRLAAVALACLAVLPVPAWAAGSSWSPADLESQLMCLVCNQRLDQSESAFADQIRAVIQQKHDAGWSEQRVKDYLVARYGEEILAAPPKRGFDLLAWLIPGAVLLLGGVVAATLAVAWSRSRAPSPQGAASPAGADPGIEARIDAELERFE